MTTSPLATAEARFFIACRNSTMRRAQMLARGGYLTRLHVHALQFTAEEADKALADCRGGNTDWTFELRPVGGKD